MDGFKDASKYTGSFLGAIIATPLMTVAEVGIGSVRNSQWLYDKMKNPKDTGFKKGGKTAASIFLGIVSMPFTVVGQAVIGVPEYTIKYKNMMDSTLSKEAEKKRDEFFENFGGE